MHIPYGLCYALIANVSPTFGMYTSFFPVLAYFIFGSSRHLSLGTSSLMALMVSQIFQNFESLNYIPVIDLHQHTGNITASLENTTHLLSPNREHAKMLVMISCTLWVGIIQVVMFVFRMGLVTAYLSDALIKGFIVGCSLHVLTSQLGNMFGIHINHQFGLFELPKVVFYTMTSLQIFLFSYEQVFLFRPGLSCSLVLKRPA
jgi:MFS superfamily sulfate permease-like transporter